MSLVKSMGAGAARERHAKASANNGTMVNEPENERMERRDNTFDNGDYRLFTPSTSAPLRWSILRSFAAMPIRLV